MKDYTKHLILIILFFLLIVVIIPKGDAILGDSSSYSVWSKFDSGATNNNATSSSFTNRFISGFQAVSQYVSSSFAGRWGILSSGNNLIINITYPTNNLKIIRGNDSVSGEDDIGVIGNTINFTANVYDNDTGNGFSGATCYFFDNGVSIGSSSTNSSGDCIISYPRSAYGAGARNLSVNYSITTSDVLLINTSLTNFSIIRYINTLTTSNLRVNGKYYDGDVAVLEMAISLINESGTFNYDPQNITANATNAAESVYAGGTSFYPGNITRTGAGAYKTNVTVSYTFGNAVRWDVWLSDNSYSSYIDSAIHSDVGICSNTSWSSWSVCSGGSQTRTDSSGCIETQTCGGGSSSGGSSSGGGCTSECVSGETRLSCGGNPSNSVLIKEVCGNFDADSCLEFGIDALTNCGVENTCQVINGTPQCVIGACTEDWVCGYPNYDSSNGWSECMTGDYNDYYNGTSGTGITGGVIFQSIFSLANDVVKPKTFSINNKVLEENNEISKSDSLLDKLKEVFVSTGDAVGNIVKSKSNCEADGDKQCNPSKPNSYQQCVGTSNKNGIILKWKNYMLPKGMVCVNNGNSICNLNDKYACSEEETKICSSNTNVKTCQADSKYNGCLRWINNVKLPKGMVCVNNGNSICNPNDANRCDVDGAGICASETKAKYCSPDSKYNGCLRFGPNIIAPKGLVCSGNGEFVCSEVNSCDNEGTKRCTDYSTNQECVKDSNGCLVWSSKSKCEKGNVCSEDGECVSGTILESNVCEVDDRTCIDNIPNECRLYKNKYNRWERLKRCDSFSVCADGLCVPKTCYNGINDNNENDIDCGDVCFNSCIPESTITPCGNGLIEELEQCDDGNINSGDGCSSICEIEERYVCTNQPSLCVVKNECGNGVVELDNNEECDDKNKNSQDGCGYNCKIEIGYVCIGEPSSCQLTGNVNNETLVNITLEANQILVKFGERKEVTIHKGDILSVTYSKRTISQVVLNVDKLKTENSTSEQEVHYISVQEIDSNKIRITVESTPQNKDVSIGETVYFNFDSGGVLLGPGTDNIRVRTCRDVNNCGTTNNKPTEVEYCQYICVENWECEWTECVGNDTLTFPYNCVDKNSCGTLDNKPTESISCDDKPEIFGDCYPIFECNSWGDCKADFSLNEVLNKNVSVRGFKERDCFDTTLCANNKTEKSACDMGIPITASLVDWCQETYVEIRETESQRLVSRVKETEIFEFVEKSKIDISFISSEFVGYCSYCYDGIQNFDETGIDCGGPNCSDCLVIYRYFDWLFYVIITSWIIFVLLGMYYYDNRKKQLLTQRRVGILELIRYKLKNLFRYKTREEAKTEERGIYIFLERLISLIRIPRLRLPKIKLVKVREERVRAPEIMKPVIMLSPQERRLADLKRKLRQWKKEGYYGTAKLEYEIKILEDKLRRGKKSFFRRIKVAYVTRRDNRIKRRQERVLIREERKRNRKPMFNSFGVWLAKRRRIKEEKRKRLKEKIIHDERIKIQERKFRNNRMKKRWNNFINSFKEKSRQRKEMKRVKREGKKIEKISRPKRKGFFSGLFISYKKNRQERKEKRQRRKELKKIHKKSKKDMKHFRKLMKKRLRAHKREERLEERRRKKLLRKRAMLERKTVKGIHKERRKERKKKINVLKREIRNNRIKNLLIKLRLWKKQGLYGTEKLKTELKRLRAEKD